MKVRLLTRITVVVMQNKVDLIQVKLWSNQQVYEVLLTSFIKHVPKEVSWLTWLGEDVWKRWICCSHWINGHQARLYGHKCQGSETRSRDSKRFFLFKAQDKGMIPGPTMIKPGWWFGCHQFGIFPWILGCCLIIPIDEVIFFRNRGR